MFTKGLPKLLLQGKPALPSSPWVSLSADISKDKEKKALPGWLTSLMTPKSKVTDNRSYRFQEIQSRLKSKTRKYSTMRQKYSTLQKVTHSLTGLQDAIFRKDTPTAWSIFRSLLIRVPESIHHITNIPANRIHILEDLFIYLTDDIIYTRSIKQANFAVLVLHQLEALPLLSRLSDEELFDRQLDAFHILKLSDEVVRRSEVFSNRFPERAKKRRHLVFTALVDRRDWGRLASYLDTAPMPDTLYYRTNTMQALVSRSRFNRAYSLLQGSPDLESIAIFKAAATAESNTQALEKVDELMESLAISASNPTIVIGMLQVYQSLRKYRLAESLFNTLFTLKSLTSSQIQSSFLNVMIIYQKTGQSPKVHSFFAHFKTLNIPVTQEMYHVIFYTHLAQSSHKKLRLLYTEMCNTGLHPDARTFALLLSSVIKAAGPYWLAEVERLFWGMIEVEGIVPDSFVVTKMMQALSFRDVDLVLKIFERDFYRHEQSLNVYTVIINMFAKRRQIDDALEWLKRSKEKGYAPTRIIFNSLLQAYLREKDYTSAREIFDKMNSSADAKLTPDSYTYGILAFDDFLHKNVGGLLGSIDPNQSSNAKHISQFTIPLAFHAKSRDTTKMLKLARDLLVDSSLQFDVVAYHVMMRGFLRVGGFDQVLTLFEAMVAEGLEPDAKIYNMIIRAYIRMGDLASAGKVLEYLEDSSPTEPQRGLIITKDTGAPELNRMNITEDGLSFVPSTVYDQFIQLSLKRQNIETAMLIFCEMVTRNYRPSFKTYKGLIVALASRLDTRAYDILVSMMEDGIYPSSKIRRVILMMIVRKMDGIGLVRLFQVFLEADVYLDGSDYDNIDLILTHIINQISKEPHGASDSVDLPSYTRELDVTDTLTLYRRPDRDSNKSFELTSAQFLKEKFSEISSKRLSDIIQLGSSTHLKGEGKDSKNVSLPAAQRLANFWCSLASNDYLRKHLTSARTCRVIEACGYDPKYGQTTVGLIWRVLTSKEKYNDPAVIPQKWDKIPGLESVDSHHGISWRGFRWKNGVVQSSRTNLEDFRRRRNELLLLCYQLRPSLDNFRSYVRVLAHWRRWDDVLKVATSELDQEFVAIDSAKRKADAMVFVGEVCELFEFQEGMLDKSQMVKWFWDFPRTRATPIIAD